MVTVTETMSTAIIRTLFPVTQHNGKMLMAMDTVTIQLEQTRTCSQITQTNGAIWMAMVTVTIPTDMEIMQMEKSPILALGNLGLQQRHGKLTPIAPLAMLKLHHSDAWTSMVMDGLTEQNLHSWIKIQTSIMMETAMESVQMPITTIQAQTLQQSRITV